MGFVGRKAGKGPWGLQSVGTFIFNSENHDGMVFGGDVGLPLKRGAMDVRIPPFM